MEAALLLQLLLHHYDLTLLAAPRHGQARHHAPVQYGGAVAAGVSSLLRPLGMEQLAWGAGVGLEEVAAAEEAWRHSGDPLGLLPPAQLGKLVGVKVPAAPCMVRVSARARWPS